MKKTAWWALPIAAALAVTGCSGSPTPEETTPPSQDTTAGASEGSAAPSSDSGAAGAAASSTGAPAESTAASQDGSTAAGGQLSTDELVKIAEAVRDEAGASGTKIIKDSELRASAPMIEEVLEGMKVDPAECGAFAMAGMSEMLERVHTVAVVMPADSNAQTTSVNIGSYESVDLVGQLLDQAAQSTAKCSEFKLTMQGQDVSAKVEPAEADTSATTTIASVTNVRVMDVNIKTLTVAGFTGQNNVSVNISSPQDLDEAVKTAEKYIDLALGRMGGN